MTKVPVIPAIDIINGQVVRLTKGDYGQIEYYETSAEQYARNFETNGATRIHIVDLDGAKVGKVVNSELIRNIRNAVDCTLELGGGIRNEDTIKQLLELGIDRVILGSLLIKDYEQAIALIRQFPGKIIAGIDARDGQVATEGWIENSDTAATALIERMQNEPIESIIFTDIDRDGTLEGPNRNALNTICKVTSHPIIASGGVGNTDHLAELDALELPNLMGCIVGKAILSGQLPLSVLNR
ncbi:MAG: 1-(5-phosphoribosyl)-5-[(5-phosphoribosylamino)methylideneamino]imidazole-4-carboxamide isomerase [bacterium]|nr:1-(5-phosphoribosyl)-5-[(5-phosphoribosylamino)methylideneamino]imidazole-4-carboxamide isomerase [bacterium]